jgi:hypothetical protein
MDGKGLAILVLLFLITMMLFAPQRSGFEPAPAGPTGANVNTTLKSGPMINQGGDTAIIQGATDGETMISFAPFEAAMDMVSSGFKIGQTPTDPNVGLIPKEVVTTEDFGQFSPDAILSGQNFLDPRAQIGFPETIGGILRNANRQERSEPANPRDPVSIFNLSTIPPDTMRPKFEIQNEYK